MARTPPVGLSGYCPLRHWHSDARRAWVRRGHPHRRRRRGGVLHPGSRRGRRRLSRHRHRPGVPLPRTASTGGRRCRRHCHSGVAWPGSRAPGGSEHRRPPHRRRRSGGGCSRCRRRRGRPGSWRLGRARCGARRSAPPGRRGTRGWRCRWSSGACRPSPPRRPLLEGHSCPRLVRQQLALLQRRPSVVAPPRPPPRWLPWAECPALLAWARAASRTPSRQSQRPLEATRGCRPSSLTPRVSATSISGPP